MIKTKFILELIAQGENRGIEFKQVEVRPESLAKELVASMGNPVFSQGIFDSSGKSREKVRVYRC